MPTIALRDFRCSSQYTTSGTLVLAEVRLVDERPLQVALTEVLQVNALAARLRRRMAYRVLQHELRLVLSFLRTPKNGRLVARTGDIQSAARHIGSFFAESVGLGLLTAGMRSEHGWDGDYRNRIDRRRSPRTIVEAIENDPPYRGTAQAPG
ncbi:hypothetical protein [Amycolatopsis jiangsuensis]|uniref:Uncharacterized protein n=1 Tax=Amycolatopsis jiangsuensis TaxID=1181879 RepID=A0A840IXX2_9PSEU|nr:hypothetical protein [Amycolatopsis jiangsuensis]MBB4687691.1 hypothetical protein [Amycolatopsis jiangsuensis]